MATKANGQVLERYWKRGRGYSLRFSAYGERRYLTLGFEQDGWTKERAEEELANVMADVRRGIWVPPKKSSKRSGQKRNGSQVREMPLFGVFARGLIEARRGQVSENTTHCGLSRPNLCATLDVVQTAKLEHRSDGGHPRVREYHSRGSSAQTARLWPE
jgi:hypothetical protein